MLQPYRRHKINEEDPKKSCPFAHLGVAYQRCECPVWVDGFDATGNRVRRSLKTTSWERAVARIRLIEEGGDTGGPVITLEKAIDAFRRDCEARNLRASTLKSYRVTFATVTDVLGDILLSELTDTALRRWREAAECAPTTARKRIEHLRAFCAWCAERGWIEGNPAKRIKPPRSTAPGALPFSDAEVRKLLAAIADMGTGPDAEFSRIRVRAYILLLLHTGLRLGDAARLRRGQIVGSHLIVDATQKTGTPVKILLPKEVINALGELPKTSEYFFAWTPARAQSLEGHFWRVLNSLGKRVEIHCHPHRFRDTFAVNMLSAGADIRTVQLMLGHSSIRTTEKHYAHFVVAHQKILDRAARALHRRKSA